jgi:lipopolysaccharide/colanic/teichoic acid biosynthesis glycosyltransferase
VVKRSVDCVVSAVLLTLALPILLLSALIIRISSPGPALFRQARMGRGFQPFEILKLRTMAHAQGGLAYTLGPDPRITPFGKWLRRTKIDELPQLWNVLRGEMSLVGPRPVLPELTAEFRFHYRLVLRARPGLTDPASLKYSQEARLLERARDPMRFFKTVVTPDKIRISLDYMERANVWTDLGTMAMTAAICCLPRLRKLYGQLPDPAVAPAPLLARPLAPYVMPALYPQAAAPVPAMDGCVFSHELASLEASLEARREAAVDFARSEAGRAPVTDADIRTKLDAGFAATVEQARRGHRSPWNRWHVGASRQQSTPAEARESVSGL